MEIQDLIDRTADELVRRIQESRGLAVFAKRRAKFEGWLKVELIDILLKCGVENVLPEAGLIDVSFGNVAIELKTVNTNYRDGITENVMRPITMNVMDVIEDIENHRGIKSIAFAHKYVIFIVFPLNDGNSGWATHLQRIENSLGGVCYRHDFVFGGTDNRISGCIYYGKVLNGKGGDRTRLSPMT